MCSVSGEASGAVSRVVHVQDDQRLELGKPRRLETNCGIDRMLTLEAP